MKKGLVLEGGAMRGLFSAGIIDVMMEEGVGVDGLIGVSAGAVSVTAGLLAAALFGRARRA